MNTEPYESIDRNERSDRNGPNTLTEPSPPSPPSPPAAPIAPIEPIEPIEPFEPFAPLPYGGFGVRQVRSVVELARLVRRRWYVFAPVLAIWVFAYVRLFIDPTPRLPLLFNWTPSLPYHVAWLKAGQPVPSRGDLIVFVFAGDPDTQDIQPSQRQQPRKVADQQARFPGLRGQPFFKRVRGMPGDVVTTRGRWVLLNEEPVGFAKTHAHDRRPLTPISPVVIPPGQFYVQGASPDSFDSRYRESGLVKQEQVVAIVRPLF